MEQEATPMKYSSSSMNLGCLQDPSNGKLAGKKALTEMTFER